MSLTQAKKKLNAVVSAIEARQKMIERLEKSQDAELIPKIALMKQEIETLEKERSQLEEEVERLKQEKKALLPKLQTEYENLLKEQARLLKDVADKVVELKKLLQSLHENIQKTETAFIPYYNTCRELELTPKNAHLSWGDRLVRLAMELDRFAEWVKNRTIEGG